MYLLEEDLKFPKDSFKSMKYQPYEMKPSFSMVRVYQWWNYWYGEVYISFSGGLDSTVLAYIVCQAYRKYKLTGKQAGIRNAVDDVPVCSERQEVPELKLRRCNKYMFQTVKCSKYMRKINDGKCITLLTGDETENGKPAYFYTDYSEKKEKDRFREVPAEDWGGGDFMKTYYEPSEKEFVGIIIGMKMIVVKAELFCDTNYGYDGSEKDYIGRDVKEQIKVAIVAYGCNKTRLVPMDSFEIIKEEDKC